ncbi:MAG: PASTA domain-containing protein, partial [Myxococcales bacterium]|nr:PASTA domain-containing protein [Myxococcales bacterium]
MSTVSRSRRARRRKQKVPHLVGLQVSDARLVLRHRGFYDPGLEGTPDEGTPKVDIRYDKSFAPYGTVIAQNPTKGQIVDSDSTIELVVSMESLLDYLPAIFRRQAVGGGNFVENFLWIFQHIFYSIESKIDRMDTYFDVFETPEEFLPWLASWVAFTLDGDWDESQRRLFLKKAVDLYRIRGTVKGIRTMLEMYTGVEAKIIENAWPLDGFQIGVASTIGPDSAIVPPINRAHCFIVEVPLDPEDLADDEIIKIHQIIEQEKPAHTSYYLRFTGAPTQRSGWMGPVIGQYRMTSTEVVREIPEAEKRAEA